MGVEHRERENKHLRIEQQYRFVCDVDGCPYETRWVVGRWFAQDAAAAHEKVCTAVPVKRMPVKIGEYVSGSQEWHDARRGGLGGSEIAAVLGLSPWESHFSLWHRKSGRYVEDRANDEMTAGTLLEPVIISKFEAENPGWGLMRNAGTWHHPDRPWQIANPDAVLSIGDGRGALLETKFSLFAEGFGEPGTDQVPVYYDCQVQWYLDVFGLDVAYLMVFVGSRAAFLTYEIPANPETQARLRDAGKAFMDSIAADRRPSIDGHDATYEVVKALHPQIDPVDLMVPVEIARPFCEARHVAAAAQAEVKRTTSVLADYMGGAQRALFDGQRIARRQAKGDGVPYVVAEKGLPFAAPHELEEAS